ncbi:MAG: S-adenosylmethionine:tRNA ribosyltransferase-isomerase [Bacteroidales bacterium]|nr:S-adenosylmethionine:tRNA ribosyltransferase-isomerase [Bacteroidales bacterium]
MEIQKIKISEYTYDLPDEKIAKFPLENRDKSNLLLYKNGNIEKLIFTDIIEELPENNLLVMNNTKVIYARLIFHKTTGSKIEIFCLNPHQPAEYNLAFDAKGKSQWICIVGNQKKWKHGDLELKFDFQGEQKCIKARKIEKLESNQIIEFEWDNDLTFSEVLEAIGEIPIPPYLNRDAEEIDKTRYQTVYSKIGGSVAAPTAGLHFTENVFTGLAKKNITTAEVTLHVGAGTFKPVKSEEIGGHEMHTEFFRVNKATLEQIKAKLGNITAVGTTSLRTIESLYWMGVKRSLNKPDFNYIAQWEIYDLPVIPAEDAFDALLNSLDSDDEIKAHTQIIIVPGYEFKVANNIITNFHQPNSTLLLLVAAFVGNDWRKTYDFALNNGFRFLSYGDSSLLMG